MYPELIKLGPVTIYSYGFFILVGVVLAYFFMLKNGKKYKLNSENVSEIFLWAIAAVFVGGKLFFFFENPELYVQNPALFFHDFGRGFVFYGSFLTAAVVLIWRFRKMKLPVWEMFDLIGIAGAIVHGFGKIGCFMAGCCHGTKCDNTMGVIFRDPQSSAEPLNTPLYPTQLWDAAIIFVALIVMYWMKNRKWFHGQLFLTYGILYAIGRIFTENYRGDEERGFLFNGLLSHSQFIALLVILSCFLIGMYRFRNFAIKEEKKA